MIQQKHDLGSRSQQAPVCIYEGQPITGAAKEFWDLIGGHHKVQGYSFILFLVRQKYSFSTVKNSIRKITSARSVIEMSLLFVDPGPQEEDELYEDFMSTTNTVYRVKGNKLHVEQDYLGQPLKYEMLTEKDVSVFLYCQ
jgi:hypothetical protein